MAGHLIGQPTLDRRDRDADGSADACGWQFASLHHAVQRGARDRQPFGGDIDAKEKLLV